MDERLRLVARLLVEGEKMAVLCREFSISILSGDTPLTRSRLVLAVA